MNKTCIRCEESKPIGSYYKHKQMADGHLNKCIDCCKREAQAREEKLRNDPDWVEMDRARGREKYHRLNYKSRTNDAEVRARAIANYKNRFPEKYEAKIASHCIKCPDGHHNHHWSYNAEHYKDVIQLPMQLHYLIHRFIQYDQERRMYRRCDNMELLDTKDAHIAYINEIQSYNNNQTAP